MPRSCGPSVPLDYGVTTVVGRSTSSAGFAVSSRRPATSSGWLEFPRGQSGWDGAPIHHAWAVAEANASGILESGRCTSPSKRRVVVRTTDDCDRWGVLDEMTTVTTGFDILVSDANH
ncbi:hypothetical protein D8S78_20330 [Natrialba swarupiae]|nr:hypothetical protein [Natrialba swarupiae]